MSNVKADDYEIREGDAELLLNGSGVFALSNGDGVDAITYNLRLALTQTDYEYVDAFPKPGGARMITVKCVGQADSPNGVTNHWTSKF